MFSQFPVAGSNAVIVPFTTVNNQARQEIWGRVKDFARNVTTDVEEDLMDILKN